MKQIQLQYSYPGEVTIIPNQFLDDYMPQANGEFVKVYLYLLRTTAKDAGTFSLSSLADCLSCTENDIIRALKYWEKAGIIRLAYEKDGSLKSTHFLPIPVPSAAPAQDSSSSTAEDLCVTDVLETQSAKPRDAKPLYTQLLSREETGNGHKALTAARVRELKENEEISQLLFIAEQYLGKTLTPTDTGRILYFYEELHFSEDLIEYLIEYCVSRGSKSMRYIEAVALAWHQEGITTVKMAKASAGQHNKQYYTVLKAFGIQNRAPVQEEIASIDTWTKDYGFSMDIIVEACTRTVRQTGQSSFQYADGILSRWHESGIQQKSDIDVLDTRHKELVKSSAKNREKSIKTNKFNNFPQRTYDYSELEKQLLNH